MTISVCRPIVTPGSHGTGVARACVLRLSGAQQSVVSQVRMFELFDQSVALYRLVWDWFLAQPLPVQVVAGAVGLAVLWVSWILVRVLLVALRAAFRGL